MSENKKIIAKGAIKSEQAELRHDDDFNIEHVARVDISASRSQSKIVNLDDVGPNDVFKLELEGDVTLFVARDELEELLPDSSISGDDRILVLDRIKTGTPSRGVGEWLVKAFDLFKLKDPVVNYSGYKICETYENKTIGDFGLKSIHLNKDAQEPTLTLKAAKIDPDHEVTKPILIFLHGTASHTLGSFGELLRNEKFYGRLLNEKGENEDEINHYEAIYGLQHRTLTQSPVENAIELVKLLPQRAVLHLVSHSRGGLVGELLCRSTKVKGDPFNKTELANYKKLADSIDEKAYKKQHEQLIELNNLLKTKQISVERFVRVACPSRGTTLASRKLDRWLSLVFNLIGQIPALKGTPFYSLFEKLAVGLIETRTKADVIPGLEAQMPGSPFISLLNSTQYALEADLTVISGDAVDKNLLWKLGLMALDKFFEGNHDLVVNTPSMYGGGERENEPRHYFDQRKQVNHFNYFRNEKTAELVIDGLVLDQEILKDKFESALPKLEKPIARSMITHDEPKPIVYVLPGILGSELDANNKTIWISKKQLILGGLSKLEIDDKNIESSNVVESAYANFIGFLSKQYTVKPFHFDWRLPLETEAKRLAQSVKESVNANNKHGLPVSIIAHSMGGLVVRMMIANHREVWDQLIDGHDNSRFIMLGTPNAGSYAIPRVLVGQEILIKALALADLKNDKKEILEIIRRYPGVLNMLPNPDSGIDLFSHDNWKEIGKIGRDKFPIPTKQDLDNARGIRSLLNTVVYRDEPKGRVLYVAGKSDKTPVEIVLDKNKIKFNGTEKGDGRVPWSTGIPKGVPVWYMDVKHGSLANYEPAFPALVELVEKGATNLLPTQEPSRSRGVPEVFEMPEDEVEFLPDEADLRDYAMAASDRSVLTEKAKSMSHKLKVKVIHGDLRFAGHPVSVGHYFGDGIYSAEAVLNQRLNNKLKQRHKLGLYPGKINTCEVIYDPNVRPEGAVIIGLGDVGNLTKAKLTSTFSTAMKEYALQRYEYDQSDNNNHNGTLEIGISSILMGSSSGGLPCIDCIQAMLEGIMQANKALSKQFKEEVVVIKELQIFELWEDLAIYAIKNLHELAGLISGLQDSVEAETFLQEGEGGRYRSYHKEEQGWLRRLQILETEQNNLTFKNISDLARNEYRMMPNDRSKIDQFIETATKHTATSNNIPKTLFEMLLPNEMKNNASNMGDTVLLLNEASARYPWELLQDRWNESEDPLSVRFKIIRQLESKMFTSNPVISDSDKALIIGAPVLGRDWSELPGAIKEAKSVATVLRSRTGFSVDDYIEKQGFEVLDAIYSDSYRILHLAGHGVYQYEINSNKRTCKDCGNTVTDGNLQSGMVIADNMLLTPADVEKIRHVPELVFINCCYLGKTEQITVNQHFPGIAANLSTQFIRKGARAVIAAGWEVDDAAALTFADVFYSSMLEGNDFSTSVQRARHETYHNHGNVNTWGAYQCYGDPDYKLANNLRKFMDEDAKLVSATELINDLKSLANEAKTGLSDEVNIKRKIKKNEDYIQNQAKKWIQRGDVCSALGEAYKEVREFDQSIAWYTKALSSEKALVTIQATEQLANIIIRSSVEKLLQGNITVGEVRERTKQATDYLHDLTYLYHQSESAPAVTRERLSLLGSAYKRKAIIEKLIIDRRSNNDDYDSKLRNKVTNSLEQMQKYYYLASKMESESKFIFGRGSKDVEFEKSKSSFGLPSSYLYVNYLTAKHLRNLLHTKVEIKQGNYAVNVNAEEINILVELEKGYDEVERTNPTFWNMVAIADGQFVQYFVQGKLQQAEYRDKLLGNYTKAFNRAASLVQFSSVKENLEFVVQMLDPWFTIEGKKTIRTELRTSIRSVINELEKLKIKSSR